MEGIQAKHRKDGGGDDGFDQYGRMQSRTPTHHNHHHHNGSDNDDLSSMSSESSGDEDFLGNKYSKRSSSKPKRAYTRTPRPRATPGSGRRLTVKQLTQGGGAGGTVGANSTIFESDEDSSSQEEFIMARGSRPGTGGFKITASAAPSSSGTGLQASTSAAKFTFDQYVKKLSSGGSCTVGKLNERSI